MKVLGINCLNHDAAISVVENDKILFAGHAERYSRKKNDKYLNDDLVNEALSFGQPDAIAYYEKPWLKKTRQFYAGQYKECFNTANLPSKYLKKWFGDKKINYINHHKSHAASGYYTSKFNNAVVLVIDGIGEWDVVSIWLGKENKLKKISSIRYPHSLGLFYTAVTKAVDLKPCEEEYILMGMSGWGKDLYSEKIKSDFFRTDKLLNLNFNLHKGIGNYGKDFKNFDFAASAQKVIEHYIESIVKDLRTKFPNINNLVYSGGVALNCVANGKILHKYYENIWIMPNPGDAGSSIGCALALTEKKVNWKGPFLGTNIEGKYPVKEALDMLEKKEIFGIASGRAEFGPRSLGNRSLLADPRGEKVKDQVNTIKKRQKFRPFAPAVLKEHANEIFDLPVSNIPYMQYTAKCKYPELYPAICHIDNTSRVQTVTKDDNEGFYNLLTQFYNKTGCPILVNTSLNIKGQPIVNNEKDSKDFEKYYNVKVLNKSVR